MYAQPVRVAMWSCSRNLSTATMRAWSRRPDTVVVDEPLYAPWLVATGAPHPLRDEICRTHETDWRAVVATLCGPWPAPVVYEKHISKHLLPHMDRGWLATHRHAFLIREPRAMLHSFARKLERVTVEETGLPQQAELWQWLADHHGTAAPVVAAADLLADPEGILGQLCAALGLDWAPEMLAWPPGIAPTDGVWAPHWYDAVTASTGYGPPRSAPLPPLPPALAAVEAACAPAWEFLSARRLRPRSPA